MTEAGGVAVTLHAPGLHTCGTRSYGGCRPAAGAEAIALARVPPVKGRLQPKPGRNGVVVIDDTYNANPDSVRAAIDVLAASERPRVLVLGDMGEVGAQGQAFHAEVGRYAKEVGVDRLISVGTLAGTAARAFGAGGEHLGSIEAVIARAQGLTALKGTILVKGSRFMRMERVVEHLLAEEGDVLLEIAQYLSQDVRAFNVFSYISLRAVLAAITALVISFLAGPAMIRKLATYKIGQAVRDDGPQTHLPQAGTPTMGGALILVSIAVTTILWADWSNRFVWIVLAVTLGFGAVGWVDDYRKVVHRNPKGLSAREKYFWQSLIGLAAAVSLAFAVPATSAGQAWTLFTQWVASGFLMDLPPKADLIVPFFKNIAYPLGVFGFIVLTYFVIVGTSNAVNLTDASTACDPARS
jgi:hypothetical protein